MFAVVDSTTGVIVEVTCTRREAFAVQDTWQSATRRPCHVRAHCARCVGLSERGIAHACREHIYGGALGRR